MGVKNPLKNNVQKYRAWKGITQKDFAKEISASVSEIRLIEKNKVCPRPGLRFKICDYFNVQHNQMFYLDK